MKIKKLLKWVLLSAIVIFLVIWSGGLCRNYVLTVRHGDDLKELHLYEGAVVSDCDWMRVTSYSETGIEVYFVRENEDSAIGGVGSYRCNPYGNWFYSEDILWSTSGTAETLIWPYWHHIFYYL